jgi:hypothetical protein
MSNTEILQPKALEFATRSQTNMISLVRFPERISLFYLCVDLVLISFLSRFYLFLSVFIFFDLVCISSHLVLSIVRILYLFRSRDIFSAEKMRSRRVLLRGNSFRRISRQSHAIILTCLPHLCIYCRADICFLNWVRNFCNSISKTSDKKTCASQC